MSDEPRPRQPLIFTLGAEPSAVLIKEVHEIIRSPSTSDAVIAA